MLFVVYLQDRRDILLAVECQEIHWQFFKFVGHDVEHFASFAFQHQTGKLLQHHFCQPDVADFKTAPQGAHVLHAQIERVLAEERRFASARRPSEHRQFAATVALQQVGKNGKTTPTYSGHCAALRDLSIDVFPKRLQINWFTSFLKTKKKSKFGLIQVGNLKLEKVVTDLCVMGKAVLRTCATFFPFIRHWRADGVSSDDLYRCKSRAFPIKSLSFKSFMKTGT